MLLCASKLKGNKLKPNYYNDYKKQNLKNCQYNDNQSHENTYRVSPKSMYILNIMDNAKYTCCLKNRITFLDVNSAYVKNGNNETQSSEVSHIKFHQFFATIYGIHRK
jgi:hypothetical protein